jgi:hypothetical protein
MRGKQTFKEHVMQVMAFINLCRTAQGEDARMITENFVYYMIGQAVGKLRQRISPFKSSSVFFDRIVELPTVRLTWIWPNPLRMNEFDVDFIEVLNGPRGLRFRNEIIKDLKKIRGGQFDVDVIPQRVKILRHIHKTYSPPNMLTSSLPTCGESVQSGQFTPQTLTTNFTSFLAYCL